MFREAKIDDKHFMIELEPTQTQKVFHTLFVPKKIERLGAVISYAELHIVDIQDS